MANQGQRRAQKISASIGQQEAMNQRLLEQGAAKEQELERLSELQVAKGQGYADQLRLKGAEAARGLEYSKTGTLLGMSQQRLGAANLARAQARAQQMSAFGDLAKAGTQLATAGMKMGAPTPVNEDAAALAKYGGAGLTDDGTYIGQGEIEEGGDSYIPEWDGEGPANKN